MTLPSNQQQLPYNFTFDQNQPSNAHIQQVLLPKNSFPYNYIQYLNEKDNNSQLNSNDIINMLKSLNYQNISHSTNTLTLVENLTKLLDMLFKDNTQSNENKRLLCSFILQKIEEIKQEIIHINQFIQKQYLITKNVEMNSNINQTNCPQTQNIGNNIDYRRVTNNMNYNNYYPFHNYSQLNQIQQLSNFGMTSDNYLQSLYQNPNGFQNQVQFQHIKQIDNNFIASSSKNEKEYFNENDKK